MSAVYRIHSTIIEYVRHLLLGFLEGDLHMLDVRFVRVDRVEVLALV